MSSRLTWEFLRSGPASIPAEDMRLALGQTNLKAPELFIREALQNSFDERRKDIHESVRVRIEGKRLLGDEKANLVKELDLAAISDRMEYFGAAHDWFRDGKEVLERIDDPSVPFPVISISDFNANGLGGHWNRRLSRADRFNSLVLSIGGSKKWEEFPEEVDDGHRDLGSYGFGKMAFAMCSALRTVIYYSTFIPDEFSEGAQCRAMVTGFYVSHAKDGVDYGGQAYLGERSEEINYPSKPLVNADAHSWLGRMGFPIRDDEATGTTVIIPASTINVADILQAYEKWWWPRSVDPEPLRRANIEFIDEGGAVLTPKPRARPDLVSFMDCYKRLMVGDAGDGYATKQVRVQPKGQDRRLSGEVCFKALKDDDSNELANHVALVRDGLVIKYGKEFASADKKPIAGVFKPNDEVIKVYVFSETVSHDDWLYNNDRLSTKFPWAPNFLQNTFSRIERLALDFQATLEDAPAQENADAAAFLDRVLEKLFRPRRRRGNEEKTPDPYIRAVTIQRSKSGRRPQGDYGEEFVTYRIGLSENASSDDATLEALITLTALADAAGKATDAIGCTVTGADGSVLAEGVRQPFRIVVSRDRPMEVHARSKVNARWKTQWSIGVTKAEEDYDA